jgi:hypothetical protein
MDILSIQKRMQKINEYKDEIKKTKEMIDNILENSDIYKEAVKKAKETANQKKQAKETILEQPENDKLVWKIKENQEEIKIQKEILVQELIEYYQKTKSNEIKDLNGEIVKFQMSVNFKKTND